MTFTHSAARAAVHRSRRLRGRHRLRQVSVTGIAPTAVVSALRDAAASVLTPQESLWVRRIELMRELLLRSPETFTMTDLGAGRRSAPTAAGSDTVVDVLPEITRTIGEMTRSSKPAPWAFLLFRLMRATRPDNAVEMGACVGISAAYQAAALALNGNGRLVSMEGAPALAHRTLATLRELGLADRVEMAVGPFADSLDDVLRTSTPVDWAFVDGNHVESATLEYTEAILAHAAPEAVLVFDDISFSDGMAAAWRRIRSDPRFALTVDLRSVGLAVVSASATDRQELVIPFH